MEFDTCIADYRFNGQALLKLKTELSSASKWCVWRWRGFCMWAATAMLMPPAHSRYKWTMRGISENPFAAADGGALLPQQDALCPTKSHTNTLERLGQHCAACAAMPGMLAAFAEAYKDAPGGSAGHLEKLRGLNCSPESIMRTPDLYALPNLWERGKGVVPAGERAATRLLCASITGVSSGVLVHQKNALAHPALIFSRSRLPQL